ncbi:MAG: 2-hydroxyacyl-CoA dehydratase [Planctomycetes bacterium]|nr:2-hydroxyacyl-CoA dehydratase [Planctomycetota bacterium]
MARIVYSCPFVPAEWIEAHGLSACRALPTVRCDTARSPQAGLCPFARSFSEFTAGNDYAGIVFTTACDQMRRASELAAMHTSRPVFLMNVPATTQTAAAKRIYIGELRRLGRFLKTVGGHEPDRDALVHVILRHQRMRDQPWSASGDSPSAMEMDRLEAGPTLMRKAGATSGSPGTVRLGVVGGPIPDGSPFVRQVARAGATIVLDASDSGERTRPARMEPDRLRHDPVAELARAYLAISSIHHRPNDRCFAWLRREVAARDVQGLILRRYVWCDLWHAEAPRLAESVGVPVLDLETDGETDAAAARTVSRIEGFVEILVGEFGATRRSSIALVARS